jgi:hypothetical protein
MSSEHDQSESILFLLEAIFHGDAGHWESFQDAFVQTIEGSVSSSSLAFAQVRPRQGRGLDPSIRATAARSSVKSVCLDRASSSGWWRELGHGRRQPPTPKAGAISGDLAE